MKRIVLTVFVVLALGGCAAAHAHMVPERSGVSGEAYAAALSEAFDAYEQEVQSAAKLTFGSPAEAAAVTQTLSMQRFDWQLKQALARHGVRTADLAHYAESHPAFADQQQRAYAGRLARLQSTIDSLAQHVRSMDEFLLASD
jgi:hypothetical protein